MNEIILKLEKNSDQPLYIQLYVYLREEIKAGRIKTGTKLPSIRHLAKHLSVSKITVDNAYQQLLVEGYIESRQRSGMYVLQIEESFFTPLEVNEIHICPPLSFDPIKYDFNYGAIDSDSFDFNYGANLLHKFYSHRRENFFSMEIHKES